MPRTEDEKEEFIDLLFSELMLRGLSVKDHNQAHDNETYGRIR